MLVASSSPWTPVPLCARRLPVVHSSHRLVMLSFFFIVRWIFVIVSKIGAGGPWPARPAICRKVTFSSNRNTLP